MKSPTRACMILMSICAMAAVAAAQTDVMCLCPADDSDSDCGGSISLSAFGQQTIYLCVMGPSATQVLSWEAAFEIDGSSNMLATYSLLGDEALNLATPPEFIVGNGRDPRRPNSSDLVPLMAISVLVFNEEPIRFYIGPVSGSLDFPDDPGYSSDVGEAHTCETTGSDGFPDFAINWSIEDEGRDWGEVKSLYGH